MGPTDAHYPMVQHILNDVDPGVLKTTLVNFFIYGNGASPSRQPPRPRRSKERAQRHKKAALPLKQKAWGARQTRGTPPAALEKTTHSIQQKAPPPGRETVLLHARRCYDPLPDACAGAVTSVRVTPLEKVRLLRMAEKSLDMLR